MQPDPIVKTEVDAESPESNINVSNAKENVKGTRNSAIKERALY